MIIFLTPLFNTIEKKKRERALSLSVNPPVVTLESTSSLSYKNLQNSADYEDPDRKDLKKIQDFSHSFLGGSSL